MTSDSRERGGEPPVSPGSFRQRVRRTPGTRHAWRAGVFLLGLLCIAAGLALVVLPGPLTIPPVLLGLWIWSTEFRWAHRFLAPAREKGSAAWKQARRHPVWSSLVTVGGLVAAALVIWAVAHFELVHRGLHLIGLT